MKTTVKTCHFEKKCISPSLPPKSLEHLFGSPLYLISGPLVESLVTVAGAGLRKSEEGLEKGKGEEEGGKESRGREKGECGVGEGAEANCLGGGMGGGVGEGVARAVVTTGGVHTAPWLAAARLAAAA